MDTNVKNCIRKLIWNILRLNSILKLYLSYTGIDLSIWNGEELCVNFRKKDSLSYLELDVQFYWRTCV